MTKKEVQRIALLATTLEIRLTAETEAQEADKRTAASRRLWERLQERSIRIPPFHARVAQLFFRYPGTHFSEEEAVTLSMLEYPSVDSARFCDAAEDLASWGILQRIKVDGAVFYDIDTQPHLHLYRSETRELVDAPSAGVVRIDLR